MTLSIDAIGSVAILKGPWQPTDRDAFVRSGATRLIVHAAPELEFLRDLPRLLELEVHHLPLEDVRPIESQSGLRKLSINAYFKKPLDLSQFQELRSLHLDWGPGAESLVNAQQLEDLSINRFPGFDLEPLRGLDRLCVLRIANARKLTSLRGIGLLGPIRALRLLDLRTLTDLDPIAGVADSLDSLEFSLCRGMGRLDALHVLHRLTRLHVLDCGEIESLRPLLGLPLKTLLFYESTNVRDGDLSVLLKLPNLTNASFANRRHYSTTMEQIQAELSVRG
jgi:hypothetical protein